MRFTNWLLIAVFAVFVSGCATMGGSEPIDTKYELAGIWKQVRVDCRNNGKLTGFGERTNRSLERGTSSVIVRITEDVAVTDLRWENPVPRFGPPCYATVTEKWKVDNSGWVDILDTSVKQAETSKKHCGESQINVQPRKHRYELFGNQLRILLQSPGPEAVCSNGRAVLVYQRVL